MNIKHKQPKALKQLFYNGELEVGTVISPDKPLAHRLSRVLRFRQGDVISLFNGRDGLVAATLTDDTAKTLLLTDRLRPQPVAPEAHLYIALTKKDAMDRVLRQATEFGVTHIHPLLTDFCVADKLNPERATALLTEAAEQCERLSLPTLLPVRQLTAALADARGRIFWCDETTGGKWAGTTHTGDGMLVGPEGGFSDAERHHLRTLPHVVPTGLGAHILRVDTAVCAACARFFDHLG
jgi:16S rRNA (uracil1498-N3)-methyltransferase